MQSDASPFPSQTLRAYLVPLFRDGDEVTAHLFAFSRCADDTTNLQELPRLVESWGAPPRTPLHISVDAETASVRLRPGVYLGDEIGRHDWDRGDAILTFADEQTGSKLSGGAFVVWFRDSNEIPSDALLWRGCRALLVVDLDGRRLALADYLALQSLPTVLRPRSQFDEHVETRHAQEWDSDQGHFRSAADTRDRWRAQRDEERASIARGSVHPARWRNYFRPELDHRVNPDLGPHSVDEALREEAARGFHTQEVWSCVSAYLEHLANCARRHPDRPVDAIRQALAAAHDAFRSALRKVLDDYLTGAIYPDTRWKVESRDRIVSDAGLDTTTDDVHESPRYADERAEAQFLDRLIAEETESQIRAQLTPAELEVFTECLLAGGSQAEFAHERGRNPGTIAKQVSDIRRKARDVLKGFKTA